MKISILKERIHFLEHKVQMAYRSGIVKGANVLGEYYESDLNAVWNGGYTGHEIDPVEDYTDEMYIEDCNKLEEEELEEHELMHDIEYEEYHTMTALQKEEFIDNFIDEYKPVFIEGYKNWLKYQN